MTTNLWTYVLAWFPMVVLALLVGALRDFTYGKNLGDEPARRLSIGIAAILIGCYIGALTLMIPFADSRQAMMVGGLWAGITLALDTTIKMLAPVPPKPVETDDLLAGPSRPRSPIGLLLVIWIGVAPWLFDFLFWRS